MKIGLAYALSQRQVWFNVEIPDGATIKDAIERSGILNQFPEINLEQQKVGVFGKVGMVMWDGDLEALGETFSDDGTDPAYGIGARMKFGSLEVRAEYEIFDFDLADVDMLSASGVWTF